MTKLYPPLRSASKDVPLRWSSFDCEDLFGRPDQITEAPIQLGFGHSAMLPSSFRGPTETSTWFSLFRSYFLFRSSSQSSQSESFSGKRIVLVSYPWIAIRVYGEPLGFTASPRIIYPSKASEFGTCRNAQWSLLRPSWDGLLEKIYIDE